MANIAVLFFVLVCLSVASSSTWEQSTIEDRNEATTELFPQTENSTMRVLSRKRRYIVFPKGSSIQCVCKENIKKYIPFTKKRFRFGMTLGLAWKLPTEAHEIYIQKRDVDQTSSALANAGYGVHHRVDLYKMLEGFLLLRGLKGRDCLMRAVCEAAEIKLKEEYQQGTFMEELHKILFTFPYHRGHKADYDKARDNAGKCGEMYSGCNSMLDLLL